MTNDTNKKNIFIGSAWPYANGHLHLGHLAGILGADFLARYFRLKGDNVLFVSGSDCHGTPISVSAEKEGVSPVEISNRYHSEFTEMFNKLGFSYDLYYKTSDEYHSNVVQEIFLKLYNKGFIYKKEESLPFCQKCDRFLPDRYIEGECPKCKSLARGDQCDECGDILNPSELKNPKCKFCGSRPEWRNSDHFFLKLSFFKDQIQKFVKDSKGWRKNAKNSMLSFFENNELLDRSITRDIDWGVPVPLEKYKDKKIYVWFEAVCGYLSASKKWAKDICGDENKWKDFWQDDNATHYYVHGKDNIPFHVIIWPAILIAYGNLELPDRIISSEYLNLEGRQFSKSKNWAIWLPDFLSKFDPETIRFYIGLSGPENADSDFFWDDYIIKTNSELIGKFGNLINRTFSLIRKNFPEGVKPIKELNEEEQKIIKSFQKAFLSIGDEIEAGRFRESIKQILCLTDQVNRLLNDLEPWKKINNNKEETGHDLAIVGNLIQNLIILINPFLPKSSEKIASYIDLNLKKNGWNEISVGTTKVNSDPKPLYKKIEKSVSLG